MIEKRIEAVGIATFNGHQSRYSQRRKFIANLRRKLLWLAHQPWVPRELKDRAILASFQLASVGGGSLSDSLEPPFLVLLFPAVPIAVFAADDQSSPAT